MTERLENMFRQADFTRGSSFQEELRNRLFGERKRAKILPMTGAMSDDMLEMVAAAGTHEGPTDRSRLPGDRK